jgi:hypothetical protein
MKLYTEQEVYKAMMLRENQRIGFTTIMIEHLTPIELPSDEEIEKFAFEKYHDIEDSRWYEPLQVGAKWMRNKIGGNK